MPQDKYLQNSMAVQNCPYYLTDSLIHLQLRKPAFLCGESRLLHHQKPHRSFHRENNYLQKTLLNESTKARLKRIDNNPFLQSHTIYPKITNYSLSQQPSKIQVFQKEKYILNPKENLNPIYHSQYGYQSKTQETFQLKSKEKLQPSYRMDMSSALKTQKPKSERQKPVKDEPRGIRNQLATQQTINYNAYARSHHEQALKQDKEQFYSQTNPREYQFKDYIPTTFSHLQQGNPKSQNQTIIQNLEEHTNQIFEDLHRVSSNQKRQERTDKRTGNFAGKQTNYGQRIGVIQRINDQGQLRRRNEGQLRRTNQNGKKTFPDSIVVGRMTYYSVRIL